MYLSITINFEIYSLFNDKIILYAFVFSSRCIFFLCNNNDDNNKYNDNRKFSVRYLLDDWCYAYYFVSFCEEGKRSRFRDVKWVFFGPFKKKSVVLENKILTEKFSCDKKY